MSVGSILKARFIGGFCLEPKLVYDLRKERHLELAHPYLNACVISRYTQVRSRSEIFSVNSCISFVLRKQRPGDARQRQLLLHPDICWPSCTLSRCRSNTPERGPQVPKRNPNNLYQTEKNSFDLYIIPTLCIWSILFFSQPSPSQDFRTLGQICDNMW